jgi:hypothetical protein
LLREKTSAVKALAVLAAVLVLAGCNGGTVDRHALTNDASTIDSINCEAWLLAAAVARDDVTGVYARIQAHQLSVQAANFADALSRRPTSPGLERRTRARARDAATLASRLTRLHSEPKNRTAARALATRFKQAGSCS